MTEEMLPATRSVALDTYSPAELEARLAEMKQEAEILQRFFREVMHESRPGTADGDYGVIPGTAKPTLLKPGAEKLLEYYGYAPTLRDRIEEIIDRETGFYRARVTVTLVSKRTGQVVAEGIGESNTNEGRFRWRNAERTCPDCGAQAIIKGKAEYGGGWLCWAKKGGCGAKFKAGDPQIEGQPVGRIENDDPWSLWNTVLKQAKKRALIDATLSATRSSGLFTQDMEELSDWVEGDYREVEPAAPKAAPRPQPAAKPKAAEPKERPLTRAQQLAGLGEADGRVGRRFLEELTNAGFTSEQLTEVLPRNERGIPDVNLWLGENADKTLRDLISAVAEHVRRKQEQAEKPACEHAPAMLPNSLDVVCSKCGAVLERAEEETAPTQEGLPIG